MKFLLVGISFFSLVLHAKVQVDKVDYKDGSVELQGSLVYDSQLAKQKMKRPAVIVVHNWMGIGEDVIKRAEQLAELGYVAFVADIYGKGKAPKDAKQAAELSGQFKSGDRKALRSRVKTAFDLLSNHALVDKNKISAVGYCFGGTAVLEMARLGLPLAGAITFHGGLSAVSADDAKKIKTKLLVLHGAIDPYVSSAEVIQFTKELNDNKVNYEFVSYSGAVHAFTEKGAGNDISKGAAYNELADQRSFIAMQNFLTEVNK